MIGDDEVLRNLAKASRRTALMTLLSATIVISSLVYSGWKLYVTEDALSRKTEELQALTQKMEEILAISTSLRAGVDQVFIKDYDQAMDYYSAALKIQPNNPVLHMHLGYTQLRKGQKSRDRGLIEEGVRALQQAVKLNTGYTVAHYNLAIGYWALRDTANALAETRRAIQLEPNMRETLKGDPQFYEMQRLKGFWDAIGREKSPL